MHLNISSLPYYFDELSELLNDLTIKFKITSITEKRLGSEKSPQSDINLPNYETEHKPTKANKDVVSSIYSMNYIVKKEITYRYTKIKHLSQFLLREYLNHKKILLL